jgi:sporulation protein YlmC with PRC-barrel domain
VEPVYANETKVVARVGDVVLAPGDMRGIIVAVKPSHGVEWPFGTLRRAFVIQRLKGPGTEVVI